MIASKAPDLADLTRHIRSLKARLNTDGPAGAEPPRDRLLEAIKEFVSSGKLRDVKHARLTSWAISLRYDPQTVPVIEDELWFPRFIAAIDHFRSNPRGFRRCWKALLNIYFSLDPERTGRTNWLALRDYLGTTIGKIKTPGFTPDWVDFIVEHPNLLTKEPAARYGDDLANGNTKIIEDLREVLGVTDGSWLSSSLVNAQVSAVVGRNDEEYRQALPTTIALLEKHNLLADAGLARLLDRYYTCNNAELNIPLRDYSSARWGQPWLQINAAKWGRVSNDVRLMVDYWLKSDLIEKFFELLSADGVNVPRRLHFWKSLHEQNPDLITNMHFALGRTAYYNKSDDFKDLRKKMRGIVLQLEGTTPDNNAFIIRIGQNLLVEFGEQGNAMYIYDTNSQTFDLTRSYVSIKEMKNQRKMLGRYYHRDTINGLWEEKFHTEISSVTGHSLTPLGSTRRPSVRTIPPRPKAAIAPVAANPYVTQQSVISFCLLYGLNFDNRTEQGGQLWIMADASIAHIKRQLINWEFTYSPKHSAWYRQF
jgi:hypothetical protein